MIYGSTFPFNAPQTVAESRELEIALDQAGFDFIAAGAHIVSQPPGTHADRPDQNFVGPYYDVFGLLAYVAALTSRIRLMSSIIILPALPTMLIARQSAELAFLSGGRFDLGVGISWNAAEYRALGQNIGDRGRRFEEQLSVLRRLWAEPFVTFSGEYHDLDRVGLNRLPAAQIPLWLASGMSSETAMRRVARVADGWIPKTDFAKHLPFGDPCSDIPRMRRYIEQAGRDPDGIRIVVPMSSVARPEQEWIDIAGRLRDAGVSHLRIDPPFDLPREDAIAAVIESRSILSTILG